MINFYSLKGYAANWALSLTTLMCARVAGEITLVSPPIGDSASRGAAHKMFDHGAIVKQISTTTKK